MRSPHRLKTNAKSELPSTMIFVDTETRPEEEDDERQKHTLWFGKALFVRFQRARGKEYRTDEWLTFDTPEEFWNWVDAKTRIGSKMYLFAHNWNFDGSILFTASQLRRLEYETIQYINENPPFMLRVKKGKKYLALIDSLNYFTMSLDSLGESIGIPKLKMPAYSEPREVWEPYCKRDVEVLAEAVLKFRAFVEAEDLGNFRPTLASQSMNAFRHRFYDGEIYIHDDERSNELEREAYYGGRVECFQLGKVRRKLYYLDVNSLYPSVMRNNMYPKKLVRVRRNITVEELGELLNDYALVAHVDIDTDEAIYPIRYDGRLTFPVGRYSTSLTSPEIAYGLARGHIVGVHRVGIYQQGDIFTNFVDTLYSQRLKYREAGNDAFSFLCKIMMNSLYGKFGQRGAVWNEERDAEPNDPTDWLWQEFAGGPVDKMRVRLGKVQRLSREAEAANSFPAIAAHVTAYGRILIWQHIQTAGMENCYYTDTDSLVVNAKGYQLLRPFIDDKAIGKLAVEQVATTATFHGPKDYQFGSVVKHKGIRATAEQLAPNKWRQDLFRSWDWHMSHADEGFVYIQKQNKTLHRVYKKGDVQDDGRITPYRLGTVGGVMEKPR